jgi:hypothetical protein
MAFTCQTVCPLQSLIILTSTDFKSNSNKGGEKAMKRIIVLLLVTVLGHVFVGPRGNYLNSGCLFRNRMGLFLHRVR